MPAWCGRPAWLALVVLTECRRAASSPVSALPWSVKNRAGFDQGSISVDREFHLAMVLLSSREEDGFSSIRLR